MSVGARISQMRKARGWTQAALATEANLSPSAIAMYETNRRTPDGAALQKLASAFDVSVEEFRDVSEVGNVSEASAATAATIERHMADSVSSEPHASVTTLSGTASDEEARPLTQLTLTHEEAKFILFLRMNPNSRMFIESYIRADARQRDQLARTWQLIQAFQPGQTKRDDT